MQANTRKLLTVWFGFFGAFLLGASGRSLTPNGPELFIFLAVLVYGLLFFVWHWAPSRRRLIKAYFSLTLAGAFAMSARLGIIARHSPALYRHWNDWALLVFLLLGFWSLPSAVWLRMKRSP